MQLSAMEHRAQYSLLSEENFLPSFKSRLKHTSLGNAFQMHLFFFSANVVSVLGADRVIPLTTWVILFGVSA